MDKRKYVTPKEAAEILNISYGYIIRLLHQGVFDGAQQYKGQGAWSVPKVAVKKFKEMAAYKERV